jgi:hypothetical protein
MLIIPNEVYMSREEEGMAYVGNWDGLGGGCVRQILKKILDEDGTLNNGTLCKAIS